MASFLIDRHSPIRSGIAPKLRHRSPHSESENCTGDPVSTALSDDDPLLSNKKSDGESDVDQEAEADDGLHFQEKKSVKSEFFCFVFFNLKVLSL